MQQSLNDKALEYRTLLERLCGSIEDAVPFVIEAKTFRAAVQGITGHAITLVTPSPDGQAVRQFLAARKYVFSRYSTTVNSDGPLTSFIGVSPDRHVEADEAGVLRFEEFQTALRQALKEPTPAHHTQAIGSV